jgi:predicted DNA-binding protein
MADGEFTVRLDDEATRRLKAAADAVGQPVDQYVSELLTEHLLPETDVEEDLSAVEEYERTGVSYSVEEGMAVFDAAVKRWFETKQ